ncbi:heavy metal translocating P-type ATPase [Pectinatus brassicae]|uniref:Copper-exporting P-type ATPase n=1 Tax=Pectinatus brassicae TaxID=862415 RepID=A0A840UNU5_9FIRM|nr:heavy metal translocating P-type ATPase [Pectinatus brassicae]MBB5335882.1 Cu+-exporting ATPase [Pectinatus brassicae]
MKRKFAVTGMTCSACSAHVEKSVAKALGVNAVSVNLLTNSMQVDFNEGQINEAAIIKTVEDAGYNASIFTDKNTAEEMPKMIDDGIKNMQNRLSVSIVFLLLLMYISMGTMVYDVFSANLPQFMLKYFIGDKNALVYSFTQLLLLVPILLANQKYFKNGFKTLYKKSPNMDSLIAIGAGAAAVYGIFAIYRIGYGMGYADWQLVQQYQHNLYFESAGMILTLITVGKYLEARAKGKTSEAINKLINLTPKTVTVLRDNQEKIIAAADIVVGDIFIIKPGEAVAVDGIIIEGQSLLDEAAVTGEGIPVAKQAGDKIISASLNKSGLLTAKAVKVGDNTTIAQIIKLVEEASASKAPIAKLADKIAGVFVPIVITISLLTAIVWLVAGASTEFAVSTAIAVLVISCPCALGLATPVAIMVGTGKGAQNGILIKSGEALQTINKVDTIVLDKTGTITKGQPQVTDIITLADLSAKELLKIAGSLEKGSDHPLAEAIIDKCKRESAAFYKLTDFSAVFGKGVAGKINDKYYYAGNQKMMQEKNIILADEINLLINKLSLAGKTALLFSDDKKILGIIAVADTVKATSKAAIAKLKQQGRHIIMLTGDNEITAQAIKKQVGIDEVIAGVLPAQKEAQITALKNNGHKVAMVGDGINDAPALAAADVGIAIGAGTDVAIESADIVLMKNDLLDVVKALKLSTAVIRNIKENLFWAFFYNVIGIPLAAGALYAAWGIRLNPMFAAAAMSLSSVCVVTNALRLKRLQINTVDEKIGDSEHFTIENVKEKEADTMKKTVIMIEGMSCGHCTGRVEKALQSVVGVTEVSVSLEDKKAVVTSEENVSSDVLKNTVVEAGYEVVGIK